METNLAAVQRILWAARIDAAAGRWHLNNRAVPALTVLAGRKHDPRLDEAEQYTIKAGELLDAAAEAMVVAIGLAADVEGLQPPQTTNGSKVAAPRTAAKSSA